MLSDVPCRLCGELEVAPRFQKEGYTVVQCSRCGLVYLAYLPDRESLDSLYSAEYFQSKERRMGYHDYWALESSLTAIAQVRLSQMAAFCRPGRLLEIGCAVGFFLQAARRAGWEVQGVEISDYAAQAARQKLGLPVVTGSLEEAHFSSGAFDAVVMWDLIEHVPRPTSLMREVSRVLRPGGIVALTTGDVKSPVACLFGSEWHLYHLPEHLSFFSPQTITRLLESNGLTVEQIRHDGAAYTLEYLFYRLATVYPSRLTTWLFDSLRGARMGRWQIRMNLRDIMSVFSLKGVHSEALAGGMESLTDSPSENSSKRMN